MKIEHFEDIRAWQEARILTNKIYQISRSHLRVDYGLKDQIQRASVSVMANISEGFDSQSKAEFVKFLVYAKRSASEVQSHLYVALDQDYLPIDDYKELYQHCVYVKNLIGGFIRYLHGKSLSTVAQ